MGDRWTLDLKCVYCSKKNEDVWYAPTCGADFFTCKFCHKTNFISLNFKSKKLEDVKIVDIAEGYSNASNIEHSEKELLGIAKERFELIRECIKNEDCN